MYLPYRAAYHLFLAFCVSATVSSGLAQTDLSPVTIALVSDLPREGAPSLDSFIQAELQALLAPRYDLTIRQLSTDREVAGVNRALTEAYRQADIVITTGLLSSLVVAELENYPKPTVASVVPAPPPRVDTTVTGSGITNFTYVESPFDLTRDFRTFREIAAFEQLTVLVDERTGELLLEVLRTYADVPLDPVTVGGGDAGVVLDDLRKGVEAVYLTPIEDNLGIDGLAELLDSMAVRGIPTFSLLDYPYLDLGVLAGYSATENLEQLPRRVALNVLKILDGQPAAELPTSLSYQPANLIVNMATARRTGKYPSWEMMADATLLNANILPDGRQLGLREAILEALTANLGYQLADIDTRLAGTEIGIAKSNLLPQLETSTAFSVIDDGTAAGSFGNQGRYNWTAQANLDQVIVSEPAFANLSIQRMLAESQTANQVSVGLDVVQDVATAYLNVLQARTLADLRNENIIRTRVNYDLARSRQRVGAGSATDVYRWESELAQNNVDLNQAQAQLAQARYLLNQLRNRPVDEELRLPELNAQDSLLALVGEAILPLLNSPADIARLEDFLVEESRANLPELAQLEAAIRAQERQLLAADRAFYVPTVGLGGEYSYIIGRYDVTPLPPETQALLAEPLDSRWNVGISARLPIFQGFNRKFQREKAKLNVLRTDTQLADLRNQLELRLRGSLQTLVASYRNLELSREGAAAAVRNYQIVQDLYREGVVNVTSLVDAQNAAFQSEVNATNTGYQFVIDFLNLERATGSFQFLEDEATQTETLRRFMEYKGDN